MKPVEWLGDSRQKVKKFSEIARKRIGYQLTRVQYGQDPSDWKPMSSIGKGVQEIRVSADDLQHRVIYMAKLETAIYVLHAFIKKKQETSRQDVQLAKKRYRELTSKESRKT